MSGQASADAGGAGQPALSAHVRRFAYDDGGPAVLRDLRLALWPGTLTAVLGASGSGTSTLAKILAGWALAGGHGRLEGSLELAASGAAGALAFRGGPDDPRLRLGAWGAHVAYVPQRAADLLTGAAPTVGEELAFSLEQRGVPRPEMRARVADAADAAGLADLLGRSPQRLSGGEQRRLAIGCALVDRPGVLLLDDPEASLDAAGLAALAAVVDGALAAGTAVAVFGACAGALARRARHMLVLGGGTAVASGPPGEVLVSRAFASSGVLPRDPGDGGSDGPAIRESDAAAEPPGQNRAGQNRAGQNRDAPAGTDGTPAARPAGGEPFAELEAVRFAYPERDGGSRPRRRGLRRPPGRAQHSVRAVLDGASLAVRPGEVVALTGPNGAGKSTALRTLAGLLRPDAGTVRIAGRDIAGLPAGAVAAHAGTLFQDPRDQLLERTALAEVTFGLGRLGLSRDAARARALEALAAVGLADEAGAHPYELPAARQRLLALATVLARRPRVLLLDEPTAGLDRPGLRLLEAAVAHAATEGAAIVLTTHALPWAQRIAHRVLTLESGRLTRVESGPIR
ncbi:ATP-binding cassette domain-containing protein [Sinomonas mesophila]|uniref:ATP-binding cassette domain-containing protein n=1 Tax=Sinomonas mesophila TaxID=1531955 RepID=UPI000987BFC9|nr:ABC transporter ATP-binding protein [Sinomonas mesophila]